MRNEQQIQSTFFLQVVVYCTALVLFVGLVATVGINTFLSQLFSFTATETAYIQPFQQVTGIMFWWAVGVLFFFTAFCSTFFRLAYLLSLTKKPISRLGMLTKFLRVFIHQWGPVILLVVLIWVSGKMLVKQFSTILQQEAFYENRAEYQQQPNPIKFSPSTAIHEL